MKKVRPTLAALALGALTLTACAQAASPEQEAQAKELTQLGALKKTYSGVVMGFDIHGPLVNVSIDLQGMMDMDEDQENQMVADALKTWRSAWTRNHRGKHATLVVRILDFRGNQEFKETTKV